MIGFLLKALGIVFVFLIGVAFGFFGVYAELTETAKEELRSRWEGDARRS